ncbi:MAG: hypothetical protein AAF203_04170, partial [Pseudomonadota bacterium]
MKALHYLTLVFLIFISLNVFAIYEFESIEINDFNFLQQAQNECVPTSFLYMMKFGNEKMKEVYQSLPSDNDRQKLNDILDLGMNSERNNIGPLFNSSGTDRVSFQKWMDALTSENGHPQPLYKTMLANRNDDETEPGHYLRRIHALILASLQEEAPVMAGIELSTSDHKERDLIYELSHAVVIVGIQQSLSSSEMGFAIWYLDPTQGEIFSGYIYEELNQPLDARIFSS